MQRLLHGCKLTLLQFAYATDKQPSCNVAKDVALTLLQRLFANVVGWLMRNQYATVAARLQTNVVAICTCN